MNEEIANAINELAAFCGPRDLDQLSPAALKQRYQLNQVDLFVLFGGSLPIGGDVLAEAMTHHLAKQYAIVGGHGHTTEALRQKMAAYLPGQSLNNLSEAGLFSAYVAQKYQLQVDYLETESTNCGNNITNLLTLLSQHNQNSHSYILCQDATMQRRMAAGLRHHTDSDTIIINYAAYQTRVHQIGTTLTYEPKIPDMWPMTTYIDLLMGEIPRLKTTGYGPKGRNYIAQVDLPQSVLTAFDFLQKKGIGQIRPANSEFHS